MRKVETEIGFRKLKGARVLHLGGRALHKQKRILETVKEFRENSVRLGRTIRCANHDFW